MVEIYKSLTELTEWESGREIEKGSCPVGMSLLLLYETLVLGN